MKFTKTIEIAAANFVPIIVYNLNIRSQGRRKHNGYEDFGLCNFIQKLNVQFIFIAFINSNSISCINQMLPLAGWP